MLLLGTTATGVNHIRDGNTDQLSNETAETLVLQLVALLEDDEGEAVEEGAQLEAQTGDGGAIQFVELRHQRLVAVRSQVHGHAQHEQVKELDA